MRTLALLACAALACAPSAVGDTSSASSPATGSSDGTLPSGQPAPQQPLAKGGASATLEQCATAAAPQTERSATFAGEMVATASTARMEMRIDLEELTAGEPRYRTVTAPSVGVWQRSNPGVKSFTHIQQVTNLSAPASYRGSIRFRWLNARGRAIKTDELHTAACEQPAPSAASTPTAPASSTQ